MHHHLSHGDRRRWWWPETKKSILELFKGNEIERPYMMNESRLNGGEVLVVFSVTAPVVASSPAVAVG